MIIPSIDLMNGSAVQLIGGKEKSLDAGDPRPIADRFSLVGEIALIDLDAALGRGSNEPLMRELIARAPCRVGGGIRDAQTAIKWLDAGASKVILGTAARPEILRELPRDRVIVALDARDGEVVTEGWTKRTGASVEDRIMELREHAGGFLVTFVEREGRMQGLPMDRVERLVQLAGPAKLTVAGGVRTAADIAAADDAGADAQVGMALYTGAFDLAEGYCAPLRSDRSDGLLPTIVTDPSGRVLGLTYSNVDTVRASIEERRGVYFSRSRSSVWRKGQTSGDIQELLSITTDCDRDTLRFTVRQRGAGFCHLKTDTCFGQLSGFAALDRTIAARKADAPLGSYTARLLSDPELLESKLLEEASELIESKNPSDAANEAADVIYFAAIAARARGASLADVERCLDQRALRVSRRRGDAKSSIEKAVGS
jgi:phosphoribosyl-ATP pyrophosphohydrolase